MRLTIPERHRKSLNLLVGSPPDLMRSLIASLQKAVPAASLSELARQLKSDGLALDFDELYDLLDMLASLYRVRTFSRRSVKQFVEDFLAAAKDSDGEPPPSPVGGWPKLKENLKRIFEADESLGLTAKASELVSENERQFCPMNCRILTDVRPVFLEGSRPQAAAAIVQHVLKIAYHEGDDLKEFFVSLDADDIDLLKVLLSRAVAKESSLRKLMKDTGIRMLGLSQKEQ